MLIKSGDNHDMQFLFVVSAYWRWSVLFTHIRHASVQLINLVYCFQGGGGWGGGGEEETIYKSISTEGSGMSTKKRQTGFLV